MSILLPASPAPDAATPEYLDWGGVLRPIFGGALQRINRLGDRFALDVEMPIMVGDDARLWVGALVLAQRQGAILAFPQVDIDIGLPGAPVVDGAGAAGSTLALRGFTPGYQVRAFQFFSIIHGGRRFVHMASAAATADVGGRLMLPIAPMLRVSPASGAVCEFAVPMIEGLLAGDSRSWALDVERKVKPVFRIEEME